MLVVREFHQL